MDISFNMRDLNLKLYTCIKNIAVEGTVSDFFYIGHGMFSVKSRENILKKLIKSYPFLGIE